MSAQPPVLSVHAASAADSLRTEWPASIPAVALLLAEGLELDPEVTFLVGENGSGKSTVVEAVAEAYGLNAQGGTHHSRNSVRRSESSLGSWLAVRRGIGSPRYGFFLRSETMHSYYSYVADTPSPTRPEPPFHEMSHGESFAALIENRISSVGFYCMDEPEAALSFQSSLRLLATFGEVTRNGGQILCATHSPILASYPGARILEFGEWGFRERTWEELALVQNWKRYLAEPGRYLQHLLE
ncbi:AAA family ATPase [Arthrobacter sp. UM1]|uniref:AAA family ATPase n=1 Tax=Arthrobacter sp. UM1 TaxID=2766776 RepID=UPI001CF61494|nr:AAA family ATPase [Arthrobacter sp. UM1]MCB4207409.1 AAA family ATPase [Arthrobacter sp. UM1]